MNVDPPNSADRSQTYDQRTELRDGPLQNGLAAAQWVANRRLIRCHNISCCPRTLDTRCFGPGEPNRSAVLRRTSRWIDRQRDLLE